MLVTQQTLHKRIHHPLEVIPWLARIPQSLARDVIYTILGSAFTAVLFSLITKLNVPDANLRHLLFVNGVFSLCIGGSIHLFSAVGDWFVQRVLGISEPVAFSPVDVGAAFCGAVFGYFLGAQILGLSIRFWSGLMIVLFWMAWIVLGVFMTQRERTLSDLELARERTARADAERLMTVSRLQMLQAQIEPHFLFNTLANVSSLIEVEPKRARRMLDQLTLLLRSALDSTRQSTTLLSKELAVIEAYLGVLKIRMGDRLLFEIVAAPELLSLPVPAMLLQPLVENAVKHGIEPRVQGGTVRIEAQRAGNDLLLRVADDGVGFVAANKENVGLGAVRERLAVQFGASASLDIDRTPDQWTQVSIRIPMPREVL